MRLGEWDVSKDPDCEELVANKFCADPVKIITIKEIIPHPLYSPKTAMNDIGLIRLENKVHFTGKQCGARRFLVEKLKLKNNFRFYCSCVLIPLGVGTT